MRWLCRPALTAAGMGCCGCPSLQPACTLRYVLSPGMFNPAGTAPLSLQIMLVGCSMQRCVHYAIPCPAGIKVHLCPPVCRRGRVSGGVEQAARCGHGRGGQPRHGRHEEHADEPGRPGQRVRCDSTCGLCSVVKRMPMRMGLGSVSGGCWCRCQLGCDYAVLFCSAVKSGHA